MQRDLLSREPDNLDRDFLRQWIDEPGLPHDALLVRSDALDRVDVQRERWEHGKVDTAALDTASWSVQQWLHFLNHVSRPHDVAQLAELDRRIALSGSRNAEIAHAWFRLAIASNYAGIDGPLEQYLETIGRLKLIKPLYIDLMKTPAGVGFARRVYGEARPGYHAIARASLDRVVK